MRIAERTVFTLFVDRAALVTNLDVSVEDGCVMPIIIRLHLNNHMLNNSEVFV